MNARWPLACGVVAGPLFVVTFLVAGTIPAGYDPLRHPVSSLAIGDLGWIQTVNFIVTGGLVLVFAAGLWSIVQPLGGSRWGAILIGIVALGFFGAGIFTADPRSGYPSNAADRTVASTTTGLIHDLFSTLVFAGLPMACFVFARWFARRRERGWAVFSVASGVGMLVAFIPAALGFEQTADFVEVGGLFQRISLVVGLGWLALLAFHMRITARQLCRRVG